MKTPTAPTYYVLHVFRDQLEGVFSSISAAADYLFEDRIHLDNDTGGLGWGTSLCAIELDTGCLVMDCTLQLDAECIRLMAAKQARLASARQRAINGAST